MYPYSYARHVLSLTSGESSSTTTNSYSNLLSHGVVDAALNYGSILDILTQFRSFIGLSTRLDRPDPLVRWEVPHVYLFNPALLPKPLDWTEEITVAGHVTLRDGRGNSDLPHALTEFTFSKSSPPVVYFGVSAQNLAVGEFEDLVRKVDQAAQHSHARVIIQARELRDPETFVPHRSSSVYMTDTEIRCTSTTSPSWPFTSTISGRRTR